MGAQRDGQEEAKGRGQGGCEHRGLAGRLERLNVPSLHGLPDHSRVELKDLVLPRLALLRLEPPQFSAGALDE